MDLSPPLSKSKRIAAGTIGTDTPSVTEKPLPFFFNHVEAPLAASSPIAEPPLKTMAWISSTRFAECKTSVSRVPGAPPLQSTAANAAVSGRITVVPLINFIS